MLRAGIRRRVVAQVAFGGGRLRFVFRRHLADVQDVDDLFPRLAIGFGLGVGEDLIQRKGGTRLGPAVTGDAVFLENRSDLIGVADASRRFRFLAGDRKKSGRNQNRKQARRNPIHAQTLHRRGRERSGKSTEY